jgi:hypothetical protein
MRGFLSSGRVDVVFTAVIGARLRRYRSWGGRLHVLLD